MFSIRWTLVTEMLSGYPLSWRCNELRSMPMLVIWEVSRRATWACVQLPALPPSLNATPAELTTEQGYRLLDEIALRRTLMVFTPASLKRPDLYDLIATASRSLAPRMSPSATPLLTAEAIQGLRIPASPAWPSASMARCPYHDELPRHPRNLRPRYSRLRQARDIGLDTQLQTTVTRRNMHRLPEVAEIARKCARACGAVLPDRDRRAAETDDFWRPSRAGL